LKNFLPLIISSLFTLGLFISGGSYIYHKGAKGFVYEEENPPAWGYPDARPHVNTHENQGKKTKTTMTRYITRVVPSKKESSEYDKHLIFVGGSNTFGDGLNDDESFAETLIKMNILPKYEPYIMAYEGWGPNNILARMLDPYWHLFIKQKSGVMVYFFILNHISRVCGEDSYFDWSSGVAPAYGIEGDDLVNYGFHADTKEFKLYVFKRGLQNIKRELQDMMGIEEEFIDIIPPNDGELDRFDDNCIMIFAKIVAKMKEAYLTLFPESQFLCFYHARLSYGKK
jgi:hypothetical protein